MPIKSVTCLVFGPNPSALVRGIARDKHAAQFGIQWRTFQMEPYLDVLLSRRLKNKLFTRKALRLFGKILTPLMFSLALPRILKSDLVYVIKTPPIWLSRCLAQFKAISIIDFDDPIWIESMSGPKWFQETMKHYDGFSCDNEIVLDEVERMSFFGRKIPGVVLVGNLLSDEAEKSLVGEKKREISNQVTIGWVGSFSTFSYILEIKSVLETFFSQHPEARLVLLGPTDDQIKNLNIEADQLIHFASYDELFMVKQLTKIDIGLFPLDSEPLSYLRGTHKINMYSRFGIPTIASKVPGLGRSLQDGFNGYVCSSAAEWSSALTRLVSDPKLRANLSSNSEKMNRKFEVDAESAVSSLVNFCQTIRCG